MDLKLVVQAITKFMIGSILVGALIFVPAGSFAYRNGWLHKVIPFIR